MRGLRRAALLTALCLLPAKAPAQILVSTGMSSGLRLYYPAGNDWWLDPTGGRLDFVINGVKASPAESILSNGCVGIGTTNPLQKLGVQGGITLSGTGPATTNSVTNALMFYQTGHNIIRFAGESGPTDPFFYKPSGTADMRFAKTDGTTTTDLLTIANSGRLGVGTTAPNSLLHAAGANAVSLYFELQNTNSGALFLTTYGSSGAGTHGGGIDSANTNSLYSTNPLFVITSGNSPLYLFTNDNPRITIAGGGNVGVGTTNPGYLLDVNGSAKATDLSVTGNLKAGTWQTVYENTLASPATSVTVSGLTGNTDLIYKVYFVVSWGSSSGGQTMIRINGDSGTNYTYTRLGVQSGSATGSVSSAFNGIFAGAPTTLNGIVTDEAVIFAKSGINRGYQSNAHAADAGGTGNAEIDLLSGQWKNSTDEITSLSVVANQTNGLGTGSYIRIETIRRPP